jgi:hypothetical protein
MSRMLLPVLALLAAGLLGGCASDPTRGLTDEQVLSLRAEARWKHLIAGEFRRAYEYLTPGARAVTTPEAYEARFASRQVDWKAARVVGVACPEEERCVVSVSVDYTLLGGLRGVGPLDAGQHIEETWLKLDGRWFHLPRR